MPIIKFIKEKKEIYENNQRQYRAVLKGDHVIEEDTLLNMNTQLKEAEVANRKLQADLAAAESQARGPLREEVIRLSYADPDDVAKTLQGILGIPAEGTQPIAGTQPSTSAGRTPSGKT